MRNEGSLVGSVGQAPAEFAAHHPMCRQHVLKGLLALARLAPRTEKLECDYQQAPRGQQWQQLEDGLAGGVNVQVHFTHNDVCQYALGHPAAFNM